MLEIMFVLGVFAFLTVLASGSYILIKDNISLKNDTYEIANALRGAQSLSVAAFGGVGHGVYFFADKYVTYDGNSWAEASNKSERKFTKGLSIDTLFPGFAADVRFGRLTGTSTPSTIKVNSGNNFKTIILRDSGKIILK